MSNILDTANVATLLILAFALVGAIQVVVGDLSYEEYIRLMDVPAGGLAVGRGLAALSKRRA